MTDIFRNALAILVVLSFSTKACLIFPTYEEFKPELIGHIEPQKPEFEVAFIERGTDDGDFASCSDAGIIGLKLLSSPNNNQGYIFEIIEGAFEDSVFPGKPVILIENGTDATFNFVWLDGVSEEQEPISIKLKITSISSSGMKSESQILAVEHPGVVARPWWKFW